uniref:SDR family oxidoreductase n=1 Tax=Sphingomonas mali TaxID=40682 RepID=UPI000B1F599E
MSNEQKVVVITGASQGIGGALVKSYRDRNYRVVATSRSIKQGSDPDVLAIAGDVGDPATAQRIVKEALERFGRIDSLVNNAGVFIAKPFVEYTAEDFASKVSTNLAGFFHITQAVAAELLKQGSGHIVSITTSLTDHAIA